MISEDVDVVQAGAAEALHKLVLVGRECASVLCRAAREKKQKTRKQGFKNKLSIIHV